MSLLRKIISEPRLEQGLFHARFEDFFVVWHRGHRVFLLANLQIVFLIKGNLHWVLVLKHQRVLGIGWCKMPLALLKFRLDKLIDQGSLVTLSVLDLLDERQVLVESLSVTDPPKLKNWTEEIRFKFGFAFQKCGLALHQNKGILDYVFKNKIARLFVLQLDIFDDRLVIGLLANEREGQIHKVTVLRDCWAHIDSLIAQKWQHLRYVGIKLGVILEDQSVSTRLIMQSF